MENQSRQKLAPNRSARRGERRALGPKSGEGLDALFDGALKLFQSRAGYRFSLDALLLAYYVALKRQDRAIDLGTGNGVIPLTLALLHPKIVIEGIEYKSA